MSLFRRESPVLCGALESETANSCADIHGESFAHSWSAQEFESMLSARETIADGIFDGRSQALLGFVVTRAIAGEGEILTVALKKAVRGRGNGALLLEHHLRRLASAGVQRLYLEVSCHNSPALKLYRAMEFEEVGRRPSYYRLENGESSDAILMARNL